MRFARTLAAVLLLGCIRLWAGVADDHAERKAPLGLRISASCDRGLSIICFGIRRHDGRSFTSCGPRPEPGVGRPSGLVQLVIYGDPGRGFRQLPLRWRYEGRAAAFYASDSLRRG